MSEDKNNSEQRTGPLLIDRRVPSFTARSTQGIISLDDYLGNWVILFSHPADFTPVCTSEFIGLQRSIHEFEARKCALLGLSIDSIYSHVAWVRNIKERFDIEITFPIIEDISMSIASAYCMLDETSESTATVRAVFFINPSGLLRAKIYYPMQVGRSVAEILRTLSALQAVDQHGMSAAEGWQPGEKLVPMAPTTVSEADKAFSTPNQTEWYYTDNNVLN